MSDGLNAKLQRTMLNKQWVGQQIQKFRLKYFEKATSTGLTAQPYVEAGRAFPSWPTLVNLAQQCGVKLSEMIMEIEPVPQRDTALFVDITVHKANRDLHRQLERLLNGDNVDMATAIATTLTVFSEDVQDPKANR